MSCRCRRQRCSCWPRAALWPSREQKWDLPCVIQIVPSLGKPWAMQPRDLSTAGLCRVSSASSEAHLLTLPASLPPPIAGHVRAMGFASEATLVWGRSCSGGRPPRACSPCPHAALSHALLSALLSALLLAALLPAIPGVLLVVRARPARSMSWRPAGRRPTAKVRIPLAQVKRAATPWRRASNPSVALTAAAPWTCPLQPTASRRPSAAASA